MERIKIEVRAAKILGFPNIEKTHIVWTVLVSVFGSAIGRRDRAHMDVGIIGFVSVYRE